MKLRFEKSPRGGFLPVDLPGAEVTIASMSDPDRRPLIIDRTKLDPNAVADVREVSVGTPVVIMGFGEDEDGDWSDFDESCEDE